MGGFRIFEDIAALTDDVVANWAGISMTAYSVSYDVATPIFESI